MATFGLTLCFAVLPVVLIVVNKWLLVLCIICFVMVILKTFENDDIINVYTLFIKFIKWVEFFICVIGNFSESKIRCWP